MLRSLWLIIAGCVVACLCDQFRQEQVQVKYFNPKYVSKAQALTRRAKRGEPYRTNITFTSLQAWDNNVTAEIIYKVKDLNPVKTTIKICDIGKHKWMLDFLIEYMKIKASCPFQPGTYELLNIEIPPRNFPLPIPKGEHRITIIDFITQTKEVVLHITGKVSVT